MTAVQPFRIAVPEADLVDLRERLARTRWPEAETVDDWSQGVPLAYLHELCRHWQEHYDWRATEARLNRLDHFRTRIDGLDIHFVHVRSPHPEALPLVITHGWPGSILEFEEVIGPLTDPPAYGGEAGDAFHLVLPSLPGLRLQRQADRTRLGHLPDRRRLGGADEPAGLRRFGAQGGDWGSSVSTCLAQQHPAGWSACTSPRRWPRPTRRRSPI